MPKLEPVLRYKERLGIATGSAAAVQGFGIDHEAVALSAAAQELLSLLGQQLDLPDQAANTVFAAPDGSSGAPDFRALTAGDISGLPATSIQLGADTSPGATTCILEGLPPGPAVNLGWFVFDPYTAECEIRKWTGGTATAPTFTALTYAHSAGDSVLWAVKPAANVKWFGAKGDGSTNDAPAIQEAIDNMAGGGAVLIPQGIYSLDAKLEIVNDNISILGEGWGSELKLSTSAINGTRILEVTGDNTLVAELSLNGNYAARSATLGATVIFISCTGWNVVNCKVASAGFDSVAAWNAEQGLVTGNHITGGTDSGIDFVEGSRDILVTGNIITATSGTLFPIALDSADVGTYGLVSRVSVIGNAIITGAANITGICVESTQQCIISGNAVYVPTAGIGIWLYSDGIDNCVNGNTVYLLNGSGTTYGIDLNDQNDDKDKLSSLVANNVVVGSSSSRNVGIHAYYTGAHLTGNHVRNVATGIKTDHGNKTGIVYMLDSNVILGCGVNYNFSGSHSNKAAVYADDNFSGNPVSYDWATDGGCDIFWRGQRLDQLTCYGLYLGRVQGDVQFATSPATGTWAVGDRIYNSAPTVNNAHSWVCITAGTPGTWMAEGPPSFIGWVTDSTQNQALGTLPANSYVSNVRIQVTEAFDSDGSDEISVGYDADPDAFATATDVSSTGIKSPGAGTLMGFNGTSRDIEVYYVNGGSEPTTGKALVLLEWRTVYAEPA